MALLSYEEGLEEIDSFFNGLPDGRNSTVGEHVNDPAPDNGNALVAQHTAASASSTVRTQEDPKPTNAEDASHELHQFVDADEFDTLMEDLDQVTASETSPSNPKGRIDFILNDVTSPPATAAQPAYGHDKSVIGEVDDAGPQSLPPELDEEPVLKADKSHTTSAEAFTSPTTKATGVPSTHGPAQPQSPSCSEPTPVPLANVQPERDLALLSPRRGPPFDQLRSSGTRSPPHDTTRSSPPLPPSLPSEEDLPSATPSQPAINEPPMRDDLVPSQKFQVMPSSGGKSSLMEEMRDEEEESAGLIRSQNGRMEQPNLVAAAKEAQISHEQALTSQHLIKEADTARQKAETLITSRDEVKPSPEASDITDTEEADEDTEDVEEASAVQQQVSKPTGKAKKGTERKTSAVKAMKATKATKKTTKRNEEAGPMPQRRKSGRNQPSLRYDEDTTDEADDEIQTQAPPKQTVPAKRKAEPKASPAPQNKRAKKDSRPTTRASEGNATATSQPAQAANTIPSLLRPKGGQPMGKFEQKNLKDAWHDPQNVTMGPRKTRGQKEEEEKSLPNAGRAAKERHKRKSV